MSIFDKKLIAVVGHYGAGKTNISINIAIEAKRRGLKTMLVDLDIVNPYFRAEDAREKLKKLGIELESTLYANTNLDIPAITASIDRAFQEEYFSVFDVGGDDQGALALGRYKQHFVKGGYEMLYVINGRRLLTKEPEEAAAMLREIEESAGIAATGIINNTNLGGETTTETVGDSTAYAHEVSKITRLPVVLTTALSPVARSFGKGVFPIEIYTRSYW